MPLAHHGRLVSNLLQQLRKRLLISVKPVSVAQKSVQMAVLARLNDSATGTTDRIGTETIGEQHAFVGNAIQIRRCVDL